MYYSKTASLADFFSLLLDKQQPALQPAVKLSTTADKFEALVPRALLACISPSASGSARSRGGRPKKNSGEVTASRLADAPSVSASDAWKKSSYLSFLYNAYPNARARRETMAEALCKNPSEILSDAEQKAQQVLYKKGEPCFDAALLTDTLTNSRCIPTNLQDNHERYISRMQYYMRTNPERALSRGILALLLSEQCDSCMDILFPSAGYSDDDSASPLARGIHLFESGKFSEAASVFENILNDTGSPDRAQAACRLGKLYRYGYGVEEDPSRACDLFARSLKLGGDAPDPEAAYELYLCERDGAGTPDARKDEKQAQDYLYTAAKGKNIQALLELGGMYYAGNERFHIEKDLKKAAEFYRTGAECGDTDCEKMYGRCLQLDGKTSQARYHFFKAAKEGDVDASVLLSEMDLTPPVKRRSYIRGVSGTGLMHQENTGICFVNAKNEMTDTFTHSLPKGWSTEPFSSLPEKLSEVLSGNRTARRKAVLLLADSDVRRNMQQLGEAVSLLEQFPADTAAREDIIERIHFYVRTEEDDDLEIKMVDSFNSVNELRRKLAQSEDEKQTERIVSDAARRRWYYHIRICNPIRDASQYLLSHAPLFLPVLQDKRQQPNILFVGGGSIVLQLICDMLSVFPYTRDGKPLTISVLSENAGEVQEAVEERMPELLSQKSPVSSNLHFITLSKHDLWKAFTIRKTSGANDAGDKELQKILSEANYYIVGGDDDRENVQTATWLRGTLLASGYDFEKLPFIAVYVRDNLLARQASRFSVINEGLGFSWYNNYNLFCFGSSSGLYTYRNLEEGELEKRALSLHLSYYKGTGARKRGEAQYWCRFYNRDTSRMSALSITYKAFLFGITLDNWYDYGQKEQEAQLAAPLRTWLSDDENLENAARMEHERWMCFMCSRGWRHATIEQMKSYLHRGNPGQQLYLAKLHPCIVSWQRLREVQDQYNKIQQQRNPEKKDRDLIKSDFDIARAIPGVMRV